MVRCIDCGFLALRNEITGALDEVDADYRDSANPPKFLRPGIQGQSLSSAFQAYDYPYSDVPLCAMQVADFRDELGPNNTGYPYPANMVWAIISKDRQCSGYDPWQVGFTPKEHREIADRRTLLEWHAAQEKERRVWEATQQDKAEGRRRIDALILILIAGAFTILGVALGVVL